MTLADSEPPIWRRLELDSRLDLRSVHRVLQAVMGWSDSHLHEFTTSRSRVRLLADSEVEEGMDGTPERDVRLDEVLADVGDAVGYLYDFGDAWDHDLRLEAVRDVEPAQAVRVVDGAAACPLEDAGGTGAWNVFVRWLVDGDSDDLDDEHLRHLAERAPFDFDPARFDVAEAQASASAAALTTEQLSDRLPPHPDLAALVAALPEEGVRLLAGLSPEAPVPTVDRAAALRPLLTLLDLARDGIDLTPTGLMKQASVRVLLERLGWGGDWVFGRTLREDNLPPVRWVRRGAQTLGLVRRHAGRLVLTPAGREVVGDADGLWQHLVANLPQGDSPEERMAGAIWLLTQRSGRSTYGVYDRHAGVLFDMVAWKTGDRPPTEHQVHAWHLPTLWLLLVVQQDHSTLGALPAQVAAASKALWGTRSDGS
ncbi:plasmid pRiA4b ORF-3 family protein [Nocardioides sp. zg-1230]|nr:plasmid pRiA4b ORF-3 family protein [Nocardioides sp. zg-1230]